MGAPVPADTVALRELGIVLHHLTSASGQDEFSRGVAMSHDLRTLERDSQLSCEDWITKFVNAVVRELCQGLDRMSAVSAAREEWLKMQGTNPLVAAREWASRRSEG